MFLLYTYDKYLGVCDAKLKYKKNTMWNLRTQSYDVWDKFDMQNKLMVLNPTTEGGMSLIH